MKTDTTPTAEMLVDAILACVTDYGFTAPSIDKEKAVRIAQEALDDAVNNISGIKGNIHDY